MGLPLYLAMTAAELSAAETLPKKIAYMACHFSLYSTGLSNIPSQLPEGSLLILNDRSPVQGHDPVLVAQQLVWAVETLRPEGLLLDLQRPDNPQTAAIVQAILETAVCPVAVSPDYAGDFRCAVFLEPPPLHRSLADHIAPWQDRELWLEAALEAETITVTATGSTFTPLPYEGAEENCHNEDRLCCRYRLKLDPEHAEFTLLRTPDSLDALLTIAEKTGISRAVGLYQQLGKIYL